VSMHSFSAPSVNSTRARLRTIALNLLTAFWGGSVRQYRPEAHYICEVRARNGVKSTVGTQKPRASSSGP